MIDARQAILDFTVRARPTLVPELELHLVDSSGPWWHAQPEETPFSDWPYWAVAWPGGQALARHLLDTPQLVAGKRVMDFGSGGAIEGVAAARLGADVTCVDIDPLAGAAAQLNAELNGVALRTSPQNMLGQLALDAEVVLVGDVVSSAELGSAVWPWLRALAKRGTCVLVGDAGRVAPPSGTQLERLAVFHAPFDGDIRGTTLWPCDVWRVRG
ncbi:MAG: methyltransferase [Archangium sp.]|nr:methyltransferase [Archangium sp.]